MQKPVRSEVRRAGCRPARVAVLCLLALLVLLAAATAGAQEPGAQKGEGDAAPSYEELRSRLSELPESADIAAALTEAADRLENPRKRVQLILRFLPLIDTREERYTLLLRLARLEEGLGQLESAQLHYQSAAFAVSGLRRYHRLLDSAELLIQQGAYRQAELQLRRVLEQEEDTAASREARIALARVRLFDDRPDRARELLGSFTDGRLPDEARLLYQLRLIAGRLEITELKDMTERTLLEQHAGSPEAALIRGEAESAPDVHSALGLLPDAELSIRIAAEDAEGSSAGAAANDKERSGDPATGSSTGSSTDDPSDEAASSSEKRASEASETARAIQTGSFTDPENAEHMRRELEGKGFTVKVRSTLINNTEYHRVLVEIGPEQQLDRMILKLKERGYEGYPVY